MEFDKAESFHNPRKLRRLIAKASDDQILQVSSVCHSSGSECTRRLTAGELRAALKDPKFYTDYHFLGILICFDYHDYYYVEMLSAKRLAEITAREQAEAEIAELEEAGITGPFYNDEVEFGEPILLATPDQILELAEKIKAFRAAKQLAKG